ncbi:helix-turn-helix domain-containing protein [Comamonas sp.]|uniref:helix-turn-helix domain-containing protein n=1 Tax=Comamonas sp. TaxID=34028 RepID=UPI0012C628A2|nr:helix-turn-helix domain-containing protein [Comamonas sp.]MPT09629.1 hypothetical protein [Comamonas sp.]
MANDSHAAGFAVCPGAPVGFNQRLHIVRRVLASDRVIVEDPTSGHSEVAFLYQLTSVTKLPSLEVPTDELVPAHPELLSFAEHEIAQAEERLAIIAPLLAMHQRKRRDTEARAKEVGVSVVTLYKWIKNFNGSGLVGLIDSKRGAPSITKLNDRVEQIIRDTIDKIYLSSQQLGPIEVHHDVKERCELEKLPVPHINTVRNRVAMLPQNLTKRRRGHPDLADKNFPTPGEFPAPFAPLGPVQIDHVRLDITVVFSDTRQPWGRPWLTLIIDVMTRVIVGFYLSMRAPSSVAAGMALVMGMLPKNDYLASLGVPGHWPVHGKILKVVCDNAKEFRGNALKFGCKENLIDMDLRPVKTPRYGAHIERMIGNVNAMLRKKPGTTFSSPAQRGTYNSRKKSAYTLHELEIEVADWIVNHYHVSKHSFLKMPPITAWERAVFGDDHQIAAGLPIQISDPEKLKLDFLPMDTRVVSPTGVRMNKADYYHEALNRWINAPDPDHPSEKRQFVCKYHPSRKRELWFLDPELKQYIKLDRYPFHVPVEGEEDSFVGVDEYMAAEARKHKEGEQLEDSEAKAAYRRRSADRQANAVAETKRVRRKSKGAPRSQGQDRSVIESQMQPERVQEGFSSNPFLAFAGKKITPFEGA